MDIGTLTRNLGPLVKRNSSTILTGIAVAGSIGSTILAVKATPQAVHKLDQAYLAKNAHLEDEFDTSDEIAVPLTRMEVIKIVWKDYIPAVGVQVVTIGCIIGAQSINLRKQAALISLATVSETAFREYQERVRTEAPATDRKVRDDLGREAVAKHPVSEREVVIIGNGDQLFYDENTDRYFMTTMQKVQKAVNDINFRVFNQQYASLNEFYEMIGLKRIADGDESGWTAEHTLEIDYVSTISDDDRPAIVLRFYRMPLRNYWKGFQ